MDSRKLCPSSRAFCSSMLTITDITGGGGENVVSGSETWTEQDAKRSRELLRLAQDGDEAVLADVKKLLTEVPATVKELGDLAQTTRANLLKITSDGNLLRREAQSQRMTDLADEIAGPQASVLERLLAERIVIAGVQLNICEICLAQKSDIPLTVGDYFQRCIDRAQRRYLNAIKTLAQVRKLGLPALQVNIAAEGGKQVNVA